MNSDMVHIGAATVSHLAWSRYVDALLRHAQERSVESWLACCDARYRWRALHVATLRVLMS